MSVASFAVTADPQLIVSLDFELYWGVHDRVSLDDARSRMLETRDVVRRLLDMFARRQVRATWATVGLLMCQDQGDAITRLPAVRPHYADPRHDPYRVLTRLRPSDRMACFAPDLVQRIVDTPGQELASHTFSHYLCREPGVDPASWSADLVAARSTASRWAEVTSLVFPRNGYRDEHLAAAARAGFRTFRGVSAREQRLMRTPTVGRIVRLVDAYAGRSGTHRPRVGDRQQLLDVPGDRFLRFRPRLPWLTGRHVQRVFDELDTAARMGHTFHLWWHPHDMAADIDAGFGLLSHVLDRARQLSDHYGLRSCTMQDVDKPGRRAAA